MFSKCSHDLRSTRANDEPQRTASLMRASPGGLPGVHLDACTSERYSAVTMSKVRTTLTIDEAVMRAVKLRAARTGRGDSQVIEESLRRDMGLDLLERLWERNDLPERHATTLAVEAQHKTRRPRR
jgi:hypothetical protein